MEDSDDEESHKKQKEKKKEQQNSDDEEEDSAMIKKITDFWFLADKAPGWDRHSSTVDGSLKHWYMGGAEMDKLCTDNFKDVLDAIHENKKEHWLKDSQGRLAYILCCDQFSRNIYRGAGEAFRTDLRAQAVVSSIIENKDQWKEYKFFERLFLIMPLMHAENAKLTQQCIDMGKEISEECDKEFPGDEHEGLRKVFKQVVGSAESHHKIVEQYGRYPARNKALGREDTEEEKKFDGPRFG